MYHFVSIVKSLKNDLMSEQLSRNYFTQKIFQNFWLLAALNKIQAMTMRQ